MTDTLTDDLTNDVPNNVAWLESKITEAAEAGNYPDWENYTAILKSERERND